MVAHVGWWVFFVIFCCVAIPLTCPLYYAPKQCEHEVSVTDI